MHTFARTTLSKRIAPCMQSLHTIEYIHNYIVLLKFDDHLWPTLYVITLN